MKKPHRPRRLFFALFLLCCAACAVFFSRRPVLLILDGPFVVLYGEGRLKARSFITGLSLFRPVKTVLLSDAIGPDGVALAAADRAKKPYAALFPGRYREGAELYAAQRPLTHTIVLLEPGIKAPPTGDRPEGAGNGSFGGPGDGEAPQGYPRFLERDLRADLYRAGLAAALLAQDREGLTACLTGPGMGDTEKEAFALGMAGVSGEVRYISSELELPPDETLAAAVFFGPAERLFMRKAPYPVVLFTWMDLSLAPDNVAVVFDDSLPSLAVRAVKMAALDRTGEGPAASIPASIHIIQKNAGKPLLSLSRQKPPENY
ncbi:MAG: hypothetical protein LBH73_07240 [Spirochaetaceae bacterium]|nr:hypothetical protein [Spirochaetaceae bacterium]